MFVVKRCVQDFNEVFKNQVAEFCSEDEAIEFADTEDKCAPFRDVWHEVEEE